MPEDLAALILIKAVCGVTLQLEEQAEMVERAEMVLLAHRVQQVHYHMEFISFLRRLAQVVVAETVPVAVAAAVAAEPEHLGHSILQLLTAAREVMAALAVQAVRAVRVATAEVPPSASITTEALP